MADVDLILNSIFNLFQQRETERQKKIDEAAKITSSKLFQNGKFLAIITAITVDQLSNREPIFNVGFREPIFQHVRNSISGKFSVKLDSVPNAFSPEFIYDIEIKQVMLDGIVDTMKISNICLNNSRIDKDKIEFEYTAVNMSRELKEFENIYGY